MKKVAVGAEQEEGVEHNEEEEQKKARRRRTRRKTNKKQQCQCRPAVLLKALKSALAAASLISTIITPRRGALPWGWSIWNPWNPWGWVRSWGWSWGSPRIDLLTGPWPAVLWRVSPMDTWGAVGKASPVISIPLITPWMKQRPSKRNGCKLTFTRKPSRVLFIPKKLPACSYLVVLFGRFSPNAGAKALMVSVATSGPRETVEAP